MLTRHALAAATALAGTTACGPSYQVLYEGDVHFERCYALEENASESLEAKSSCWHGYLANHSFGQTRDRIRYAGMRERALERAPALPTDEVLMQAAPGGASSASANTPTPRDAFTPPPSTMTDERSPPTDATSRRPPGIPPPAIASAITPAISSARPIVTAATPAASTTLSEPPQTTCASSCNDTWRTCKSACSPRTGHECDACDRTYKGCMKGCFK